MLAAAPPAGARRAPAGQYDADYGGLMAMAQMSCLPLLVLFVALQRYFVAGFARSGIK